MASDQRTVCLLKLRLVSFRRTLRIAVFTRADCLVFNSCSKLSRMGRPAANDDLVPLGTRVPGAGACSRTVPLPLICTCSPAAAVISITLRIGNPTSEGTLNFLPSLTVT